MGEEQTDSVSSHQNWVTKAKAKGWASGKEADAGRLSKKRGFMLPYLPVTGEGRGPAESINSHWRRLKALHVPGEERPQTETLGALCPAVASWAGDAQCISFCVS